MSFAGSAHGTHVPIPFACSGAHLAARDRDGHNALEHAALRNHAEIGRFLLDDKTWREQLTDKT